MESSFRHEWKGSQPLAIPQTIGRFQVLTMAGGDRGSQGRVYKGLDPRSGQYVAIKVLGDQFESYVESLFAAFTRESDVADLRQEAQLLARLDHPNIVRVLEAGEDPGCGPYLAMEWVEGEDLKSRLERVGRLQVEEAVRICLDILSGLTAAHAAGVTHGDVKPGNVLLDGQGRAKLSDFGIAGTWARPLEGRGTVGYIAPEQQDPARAGEVGPPSDIFGVGVVIFEMLTGRLPREGMDLAGLLDGIPKHIVEAIERALDSYPRKRFQSAGEMAAALAAK